MKSKQERIKKRPTDIDSRAKRLFDALNSTKRPDIALALITKELEMYPETEEEYDKMEGKHVDRMEAEHRELKAKITALNAFIHGNDIFKTLNSIEQSRMIKQAGFMESYADMLGSRIWCAHGY